MESPARGFFNMVTHNLVYLSDLKNAVGESATYTLRDEDYLKCISSATATIQNLLGRNLSKNEYTEFYDTQQNFKTSYDLYGSSTSGYVSYADERAIALKHYPVDTTEQFKVYYSLTAGFTEDQLLDASEYELDDERGLLWLKLSTVRARRSVKVVYTAGYDAVAVDGEYALAPNIPSDIYKAALWQAQLVFEKAGTNLNAFYSGSQGAANSYRFVNVAGVSPEAMAVIAQYRRPKVAVF